MNVDLKQEDLVSLVKGTTPNYSVLDHPLVRGRGRWTGGHVDRWDWNYTVHLMKEDELWGLYLICRESWGK
jgi:hypothetical protein